MSSEPDDVSGAVRAFKRLQQLEGVWEGQSSDGKILRLIYQVASKKSVVIEFYRHYYLGEEMDDEMVTVYHLDGEELVLTHYCTLGNQPRMKAALSPSEPNVIRFEYKGATNLPHPNCLRMTGVQFEFGGLDRFSQTWFWNGEKCHIRAENKSDDFDEIPERGEGRDRFLLERVASGPVDSLRRASLRAQMVQAEKKSGAGSFSPR